MAEELLSNYYIEGIEGECVTSISQPDNGSLVIKFENGTKLFLYALPMAGGTLDICMVEAEETLEEWEKKNA